jgi:hypothetical protein
MLAMKAKAKAKAKATHLLKAKVMYLQKTTHLLKQKAMQHPPKARQLLKPLPLKLKLPQRPSNLAA